MRLDIDEDYARLLGTVAGLIATGLIVADCMTNGLTTAGIHLGAGVVAFTVVRFAVVRSLWRPSAPAADPRD